MQLASWLVFIGFLIAGGVFSVHIWRGNSALAARTERNVATAFGSDWVPWMMRVFPIMNASLWLLALSVAADYYGLAEIAEVLAVVCLASMALSISVLWKARPRLLVPPKYRPRRRPR